MDRTEIQNHCHFFDVKIENFLSKFDSFSLPTHSGEEDLGFGRTLPTSHFMKVPKKFYVRRLKVGTGVVHFRCYVLFTVSVATETSIRFSFSTSSVYPASLSFGQVRQKRCDRERPIISLKLRRGVCYVGSTVSRAPTHHFQPWLRVIHIPCQVRPTFDLSH